MDDLAYLDTLTDDAFEAERCKIIANEILKAPPEMRKKLVRLQMELDQLRDKVTPEQFMVTCLTRANEHLENLSDQLLAVKGIIAPPPVRAVAER